MSHGNSTPGVLGEGFKRLWNLWKIISDLTYSSNHMVVTTARFKSDQQCFQAV